MLHLHSTLRAHRLLQYVVICLNWDTLGHPIVAPLRARAGGFLSVHQHRILERLEDQISHYMAVGDFSSDGLGRAAVKFQDLIQLNKELPQCTFGAEDLESIVPSLHASFDPYSAKSREHVLTSDVAEPSIVVSFHGLKSDLQATATLARSLLTG